MDFISNREHQIKEMLAVIGLNSLEELFQEIPDKLRKKTLIHDDGLSEYEGLKLMERLAAKNTFSGFDNYLGAGAYEHHVPALVGAVCSKSEFLTSYTPYQAEASQGMLQIIFEFQSVICALTGMDAANASVYDGASACTEAVMMTLRAQPGKNKILVAGSIHPHYLAVLKQALSSHSCQLVVIPSLANGQMNLSFIENELNKETASILLQSPNFFGVMEQAERAFNLAKKAGALSILSANPMSYGIYASAKDQGADIAIGDCQPFGLKLQYGGPYAGYMACTDAMVRQLPGRIVGETIDAQGKRGFVLTLQAREQHIRREKAKSNICTNQALAALASLVAILWYGKNGVPALALANFQKTAYLRYMLSLQPGIEVDLDVPIFNEFKATFKQPLETVLNNFRSAKIEPGIDLGRFFPELGNQLLICVTETKSKEQLDHFIKIASEVR